MDWPHDPDGDEGSEGMRKYDMAILAKKVDEDEDFPLSKEAFLDAHGDEPIRVNHERVVSVDDIFEHVEPDEFEDIVSFHKAVGDAMRAGGFWKYHPKGADPETTRA
jgi:predicted HAD superfamily phosphohydrolase